MNKKLLIFIWLVTILLGPVTLLLNLSRQNVPINNLQLINIFQRGVALVAIVMLFWQIVLGSMMQVWTEKFGGWVFKWHLTEGAVAYSLIFLHPLAFLLFNYVATKVLDPFYVYTDFCLACPVRTELFYTFGRLAFWLLSAAVLAAKLRTQPWWRENWRKFHIFNYVVFLLVAVHSYFSGSDASGFPFVIFYIFSVPVILGIIIRKIYLFIKS
jgi:predicted ferric reductase